MKHSKRRLYLTLLLLGALFCSPTVALAEVIDGIYYELNSDALTASVTWNSECSGDIVIPAKITYAGKTYSVTSIGTSAFQYCSGLTSVEIPNSVISIGEDAFWGCSGLTSIEIPNSVTYIGWYAFDGCSGLTSVVIPNSVTSIGSWAFYNCSGLKSVEIPNSVISIGNDAFRECSGLTSVTIGNSVKSIGEYAFYYCQGLTSVAIPNSVKSIGNMAFGGCSGLNRVQCDAVTPPSVESNTFDEDKYSNAELVVPGESIAAYKAHSVWSKFSKISDLTGVEDVVADGGTVTIYNLSGVVLYENAEPAVLDGLEPGFYIVRQGNVTRKIGVGIGSF